MVDADDAAVDDDICQRFAGDWLRTQRQLIHTVFLLQACGETQPRGGVCDGAVKGRAGQPRSRVKGGGGLPWLVQVCVCVCGGGMGKRLRQVQGHRT